MHAPILHRTCTGLCFVIAFPLKTKPQKQGTHERTKLNNQSETVLVVASTMLQLSLFATGVFVGFWGMVVMLSVKQGLTAWKFEFPHETLIKIQ